MKILSFFLTDLSTVIPTVIRSFFEATVGVGRFIASAKDVEFAMRRMLDVLPGYQDIDLKRILLKMMTIQ